MRIERPRSEKRGTCNAVEQNLSPQSERKRGDIYQKKLLLFLFAHKAKSYGKRVSHNKAIEQGQDKRERNLRIHKRRAHVVHNDNANLREKHFAKQIQYRSFATNTVFFQEIFKKQTRVHFQ
jgi:hypothetical protein